PSADAGADRPAGRDRGRWPGHAAGGAGCAGTGVPGAARHDPRPCDPAAPAVHSLLRLRTGSVARAAGRPAARCRGAGQRAVPGGGGDGGRLRAASRFGSRIVGHLVGPVMPACQSGMTGLLIMNQEESMSETQGLVPAIFDGWRAYQEALTKMLAPLDSEQLDFRAAPNLRSVGTIATHIIGARARWFYL